MSRVHFRGHHARLILPSPNGVRVITRSYAGPSLDLDPIPRLPGDVALTPYEELQRTVSDAMQVLSSRERLVVQLRFGFISGTEWSLDEIAELFEIDEITVQIMLSRALQKLRDPLSHLA